jgi:hypothetical protein
MHIKTEFINFQASSAALVSISVCFLSLLGLGKANTVLAFVENGVIWANEDVTKNPQRTRWRCHIHTHEATHAHGDTHILHLEDVILWRQYEVLAIQFECDSGQRGEFGAGDDIFANNWDLLGTDDLVDLGDILGRAGQQGSASVSDGLEAGGDGFASNVQGIDFELPVLLTGDWHVEEVAFVMILVSAAQGQFTAFGTAGWIATQPEGEDGLVAFAAVDQVGEWSGQVVDGDGIIAHAQDTVEFAHQEGPTGFHCALGESLLVNAQGIVLAAEANFIIGDRTIQLAATVSDEEFVLCGFARARLSALELLMQYAGHALAALARYPQVG